MAQSIDDLEARLASVEGRLAALEAKVKPSDVCIYADQEYGLGSILKQAGNRCYKCSIDFSSGKPQWEDFGSC